MVCSDDCYWLLVCSGVLVCSGISTNRENSDETTGVNDLINFSLMMEMILERNDSLPLRNREPARNSGCS